MKTVLRNVEKEKEEEMKRSKREKAEEREKIEQERLIERFRQRTVNICITRLKQNEIERWSSKPRDSAQKYSMKLRNR